MTYFDGGREPTGDAAATVEAMLDAAKRTFGPTISRGTDGLVTPFVTSTSVDKPTWDQNFIRQSFLGRIVATGPKGEPDQAGSQYWVREVWDDSNSGELLHRADLQLLDETPFFDLPPGRYGRWVPATNIAEYLAEAGVESHSLSTAGDVHVHVFMTLSRSRQSSYYFTSGGGMGSMIGLALVKDIIDPDSLYIKVQMLVDTDTGFNVPQVDPETEQPVYVDVWCWPFLTGEYYEALVWPAQQTAPDCNPIPIMQIGSRFYAFQKLLTYPIRSPGVAFSDCPLVF